MLPLMNLSQTGIWITNLDSSAFYNKYHSQSKRYNWHLANVSI